MRRLHGGLLAAALLLAAGCGSGDSVDETTADTESSTIRTPTLAVTTKAIAASRPAELTSTVLVTSPEGISSPGLDAAVSVLMEHPDVTVVIVAPSDPASTSSPDQLAVDEGQTMSGFPAQVVDAPVADAIAVAVDHLGVDPDLVLVGFVEGAALGTGIDTSAVASAVHSAIAHGVPALAVTMGTQHGSDLAAAGLMLRSMLDIDLATLLSPGARILAVPSCDGGLVRGPMATVVSIKASVAPTVDCGSVWAGEPSDDAEAHSQGYATVVELGL